MGKVNELIQRFLGEPARNLIHAMYDEYVEANVKFRSRGGVKTFIIRRQVGKCCDWCQALAKIYESGEEPENVFRRHDNCKCMVTFMSEKGTYTDDWSKREYQTQREARIDREKAILAEYQSRKARGLSTDSRKRFYEGLSRKEMVRRYRRGKNDPKNRGLIAKRVLNGEYDLNYKPQKYEQHSLGHIKYQQATEGRGRLQSYITISKEEAQNLIYEYAGKGEIEEGVIDDIITREYVDSVKTVGYYYDKSGVEHPTKRFMIIHSKNGAHIVPVKERKK